MAEESPGDLANGNNAHNHPTVVLNTADRSAGVHSCEVDTNPKVAGHYLFWQLSQLTERCRQAPESGHTMD